MSLQYRKSLDEKPDVSYAKPDTSYANLDDNDEAPVVQSLNDKPYAIKSAYMRECLAEFIGTMVMIMFGDGVVAQVVLGEGNKGDYMNINVCWGIGVLFGIHASGGVSGAHLNPVVTITLALFGRMEWRKVPGYILAQMLGAFVGGLIVLAVYYPWFNEIDPDRNSTMGVFCTYPYSTTPNATAFLTEVVATALLMGGIFAIGDELNKPASPYTAPSAVCLLVIAIGMAFGMNSGYALNPARDLGPRLSSTILFGSKVFTLNNNYWWIPIVGPVVGGPIGAAVYQLFVEIHHPKSN